RGPLREHVLVPGGHLVDGVPRDLARLDELEHGRARELVADGKALAAQVRVVAQPCRRAVDLEVDAEVDDETDAELLEQVEVGVGQLVETVAAVDDAPPRDAPVRRRVTAEVTAVERALEPDQSFARTHALDSGVTHFARARWMTPASR